MIIIISLLPHFCAPSSVTVSSNLRLFQAFFFAKNEEDGAKVAQPTVVVAKARETLIKGSALFKVMFAHNNAWKKKKGHTYSIREIGRCWQMHHQYSSLKACLTHKWSYIAARALELSLDFYIAAKSGLLHHHHSTTFFVS